MKQAIACIFMALAALAGPARADDAVQSGDVRVRLTQALAALEAPPPPGQDGLVDIWDNNKTIQCRNDGAGLRCEAGGDRMQPSLSHVLTADRVAQLTRLGWSLDPSFGNYAQGFAANAGPGPLADLLLRSLELGYGADLAALKLDSQSIPHEACPPRFGPGQDYAGMIVDGPGARGETVHACAYTPAPDRVALFPARTAAGSVDDLVAGQGETVVAEIQRLLAARKPHAFAIFDIDAGYVQCRTDEAPGELQCEAASADSMPALANQLSEERVTRLHRAGYADPGPVPNYSKTYPANGLDARAIALELLGLLHDVYGYDGSVALAVTTDQPG
jgi:hypothetical protein